MGYELLNSIDFQAGINTSAAPLSPPSQASLSDGTWNSIISGDGYSRPFRGFTGQGANTGSRKMMTIGRTWGGIKDNGGTQGSGSFIQDIGKSRWGIGAGFPHIEGTSVSGWTLSTNLQLSIATGGAYSTPAQAGLSQPSAPEVGIIAVAGSLSNSISAKIERRRPATGARSLASPTSAVIQPTANRMRVTFPAASIGQTHWRVYFTFQGFGGTGIHYLGSYGLTTDIPEVTVAGGTVGGAATQAVGTLTFGANATDGETIVINGVTITFRTVPAFGEVQIGATAAATATNLATVLNASINVLLSVATYTAVASVVSVAYDAFGTAGNAYTLANSSGGNITRSAATLAGGTQGDFTRSLEFNFKDGELIPIEASYDDYPPPAATHMIRLENVLNLVGCYGDSTSAPTSSNTGVAIAVSKQNNYESYIPTHLLYLPEQVVDTLARPIDDYGYIACENGIHAIQYVGDRGDELPPCTITTVLPDIGIEYPQNWCHFRGQLLIYTAQGNLMLMDEDGGFDADFAGPVTKILKSFTTATTIVGYDPSNDCIIAASGKHILIYSLQKKIWRQIWIPDFGVVGTVLSCTSAKRNLFITITDGGSNTTYSFDTGSGTRIPVSFASNYLNAPGGNAAVKDIYEMAVAAQSGDQTLSFAVCISKNLAKSVFRKVTITSASANIGNSSDPFYAGMLNKRVILFGDGIESPGEILFHGRVSAYTSTTNITLQDLTGGAFAPIASFTDVLMFVGDFTSVVPLDQDHLPNFFPYISEARSYKVAAWLKGLDDVGNVLAVDVFGKAYESSRAL